MASDRLPETDRMLDALLSLPELETPIVSPDGQWVAWCWYRTVPASDVFAARTDGSSAPIRLTETDQETMLVSWVPDSRSVVVAQDQDGDERVQLFRVALDRPGLMQPLTEPAPGHYLRGGELHPNGRWLVYAANLDAATGQEIAPAWLYRHDLTTGERKVLARPQRACYYEPNLNKPGMHILYQRNDRHPAGRQVWLADIEGGLDREILNAGPEKKAVASWFPDGRRALVMAEADQHQRVGIWELESDALRWLVDDAGRNLESAYVPHGSERPVLLDSRWARWRASLLDVISGQEVPLPDGPGTLIPLAPAGEGEWVGHYYHAQQPDELVRFALAASHPEAFVRLTRSWEHTPLSASDLVGAEDFRWRSTDGLEIQGWLYRASSPAQGTIMYVHGGPSWHSQDRINAQIQYLVGQGFHVLDANYRGSTGFSRAYRESIKADGWGGREQVDLRAGIEALIAAGIAQPGRVGITGTSYGGYSSWHAITHLPPELVAAAAPICGMTDLVADWQTTRPDLRPLSEEMMGGSPAEVPERYRERSPIHFVDQIRGKLLIIQGLRDPNVTPENVRLMRQALDRAGVAYELLVFGNEGHGIHRRQNQKVLYPRLADFFGRAFAPA